MTRPDGTPVNAVYGFTNMLERLLREHVGTHLAVIFDAGSKTFRNRIYDQYKAHRPPPPEELIPQFALVRESTEAFGVPAIELDDWEADDLIAAYARAAIEAGGTATVISSDKDLMQLIRPGVTMLDPMKQKPIGIPEVLEKFGVGPEKLIDAQALIGDSVDNVPGVPGIGPKTAAQLLTEFGDLEGVLAAAPGMKPSKRRDLLIEHADKARLSRVLVTLRDDAPLPLPLEALHPKPAEPGKLIAWLTAQGFRSIISRLKLEDAPASPGASSSPGTPPPATAVSAGGKQAQLDLGGMPAPSPPLVSGDFGPYESVTTIAALRAWVEEASARGVVGLDTETDGLDAMRAKLVGFSLATAPSRACYVPLRHTALAEQVTLPDAIDALSPLLTDPSVLCCRTPSSTCRCCDGRISVVNPLDDTMLISFVQEAGMHGHGMDELARLHLGHSPISYDEVTGTGRNRISFADVPIERATAYAAEDADVTLRLWQALHPRMRAAKALALYEQMERRLIPILLDMEREGIKVDAADLRRMSVDFEQRMIVMERDCHRLAGHEFNVGSPKQLGEVLFDKMGLQGGKRMKTGAWGTDSSVLQTLADQGHELPARILEWRRASKTGNPPMPMRWWMRSIRARAACTPATRWRSRPPGGCRRPTRTCRTSRSARKKAAASGTHSSQRRATCWSAPTTRRSSYDCWRTSPTSPHCAKASSVARTFTPAPPARCSASRCRAWTR